MGPALPSVEWTPENFSPIARESNLLWQMATPVIICSSSGCTWKNGSKSYIFLSWYVIPSGPKPPHSWGLEITLRHTTLGRTPLDGDRPVTDTSTWQHTTLTTDRHPCRRRDSNSQYQQASGCRSTPKMARPPGSASGITNCLNCCIIFFYNAGLICKCSLGPRNTTWRAAGCRPMP